MTLSLWRPNALVTHHPCIPAVLCQLLQKFSADYYVYLVKNSGPLLSVPKCPCFQPEECLLFSIHARTKMTDMSWDQTYLGSGGQPHPQPQALPSDPSGWWPSLFLFVRHTNTHRHAVEGIKNQAIPLRCFRKTWKKLMVIKGDPFLNYCPGPSRI